MGYTGFIYEWTHTASGMKYLGSHKGTIDDGYTGSGKRFLNAVKKYGIDAFSRSIIEYVVDENDIFTREQYYLTERKCASSKQYYNISPTACGGDTGAGKQISKTHKQAFKSGKRVSWCKGVKYTEEQKKNISVDDWEIHKPSGEKIITRNMLEFCKDNNLNPSTMSAVARGKRGHHHGYRCKKLSNNRSVPYEYKEYVYMSDDEKKQINSLSVKKARQEKALPKIKYNGIIYNSLIEAIESTGKSRYLLIKYGELLRKN